MAIFFLGFSQAFAATYVFSHTGSDEDNSVCSPSLPCVSLDHFTELCNSDDFPTVSFEDQTILEIHNHTLFEGNVLFGPSTSGPLFLELSNSSKEGVLQGSGSISFLADPERPIEALFSGLLIQSYHCPWGTERKNFIIAIVNDIKLRLEDCTLTEFTPPDDAIFPDPLYITCVWDGQDSSVLVSQTAIKLVNTTFVDNDLGGLSLRNAIPWDPIPEGETPILLTIDEFKFRNNRHLQPVEGDMRAFAPPRNLFLLNEDSTRYNVVILKGHDDFEGTADLSGELNINTRGVAVCTYNDSELVEIVIHNAFASSTRFEFSADLGPTREDTIVHLNLVGRNYFQCGSNAISISPYFKGKRPLNPTWRKIPIIRQVGNEELECQAKSSELWPAGTWLVRTTLASVNYIREDMIGVGARSRYSISLPIGERSHKRSYPGTRILPPSGSERFPNEENFNVPTPENCMFSLANATLSLESLHISLINNSEERRQQKNELRTSRLALVSDSILIISESAIDVSSCSSAILISPSRFEESSMHSSVVVRKCSISNEIGQLRGLVEASAFTDLGGSVSVSIVGCSFYSQRILGNDGIGLSLTQTPRKNVDDIGIISSSLISCSFVNMSSIDSSHQPQLSHLSQQMLGCVVSRTSSHLSGSTIRDVNNGGSVLCSNSSFSSLLSSPNTDTDPTVTLPNGTFTQFDDDGTEYYFDKDSGDESTSITFAHCHFTGANYTSDVRFITFRYFPGTITIRSCSFTDHTLIGEPYTHFAGAVYILHRDERPVTVEKSNFTNINTNLGTSGMYLSVSELGTVVDCVFERCGPAGEDLMTGGLELYLGDTSGVLTVSNVVCESCSAGGCCGMEIVIRGTIHLSDCAFDACSSPEWGFSIYSLGLFNNGYKPTHVTRMTFTDCWSLLTPAGMVFMTFDDLHLTGLHFLRCHSSQKSADARGGVCQGSVGQSQTLTVQDCCFDDCSTLSVGAAIDVTNFRSCSIADCVVKNCHSGATGAVNLQMVRNSESTISLTRVAFINNTVGQNRDDVESTFIPEDAPAFVDVCVTAIDCYTQPTLSIVDYFTTCGANSIGMGVITNRYYEDESRTRVIDDAFNSIGPLLTEKVVVGLNPEAGRVELEMRGKMPIASQKYEVTVRNEGDKTEMKGEVEFVDGKGTLTSPSPTLNLNFSTSYSITSIVGIIPSSSSSSLSNALPLPQAAWTFNLAATPAFVSFTTPEQPPTLIGAKAHLVSTDQPLAFVILMLSEEVTGSFEIVVEGDGKDIVIAVEFEESSPLGESSNFVVVGEDRLLTHDTT
ncbi:hypothetical protein BLNAU_9037 [Blattamonas nauphoetae]|uniref:Uncharacterized protein n=1 Tax=Blattamonas nauphoetae TaxID=2049346 RepID=A0ABQ9XX73_9EUKA|nr:hypothetical protein BLNAU_9037 [Blattamonas nauphoetae]